MRFTTDGSNASPGTAYGVHFMIDCTAHAVWDEDPRSKNAAFLRGIDAGYFAHVATTHAPLLESDDRTDRSRATIAVRSAYAQALETFCALAASAIQSPSFAIGWMLKYRNRDLERVIGKIDRSEPIYAILPGGPPWWDTLSAAVHTFDLGDPAREQDMRRGFARMWGRFAADFLDRVQTDEYNSLKHGLRAQAGGLSVSVAPAMTSGTAPTSESFVPLFDSTYGSTFHTATRLIDGRRDWALAQHFRGWATPNLHAGIELLTISIANLIVFLRGTAGDTSERLTLHHPTNPADFDAPWAPTARLLTMTKNPVVTANDVVPWTDEEVRAAYPLRP